jgi:hypothetical protein
MESRIVDAKQVDQARYLSIEKIIQHFQSDKIKLMHAIIDLIYLYHPTDLKNASFVKIAGLLNFSINLLKRENEKIFNSLIECLQSCTIYNIKNFTRFIQSDCQYETILKDNEFNQKQLHAIRERFADISTILSLNSHNVFNYYQDCHYQMKRFFISLIEQSIKIAGKAPCSFVFSFLGSHSRKLGTPYSDTEFFIIVEREEPDILRYFKNLTQLILLKIINLGETVLPGLGIDVNYHGKQLNLIDMIFDKVTLRGYSLDPALPQASKSPLGKKQDGYLIYRLIGTPSYLAKLASLPGFHYDTYFPQIMRLSRFVYGDKILYNEYINELAKNHVFSPTSYGTCMLIYDIEKYLTILYEMSKLSIITHEKYYVRPITSLIDDLYLFLHPCKNKHSLSKLKELQENRVIDERQCELLENNLTNALQVRLLQHSFFKKHTSHLDKRHLESSQSTMLTLFSFFKEKLIEQDTHCLIKENKLNKSYQNKNVTVRNALICYEASEPIQRLPTQSRKGMDGRF